MIPARGTAIFILAAALVLQAAACTRPGSPVPARVQPEAVLTLLDAVDLLVQKNPGYQEERRTMAALSADEREQRLSPLLAANAADHEINRAIDAFLQTEAMTIYVDRYRNVSAADIRRVLHGVPFTVVDAPGDIARAYDRMVPIRNELRPWVMSLVEEIDLDRAGTEARRWLPQGHANPPEMYLVFDANAGSYTAESKGFYNLYSDIVQDLPRGQAPDLDDLAEMEKVIAHEMQHVMAQPLFAAARRDGESWQEQRRDQVIRGLVSEGAAMHCNPPQGLRQEIWEDPLTLEALMDDLNRTFLALRSEQMEETAFHDWFRASFHDRARQLMHESLARTRSVDQVEELMRTQGSLRPDLVHALGWHMAHVISRRGEDPVALHRLLQEPYSLFTLYATARGESHPELEIDPRLLQP